MKYVLLVILAAMIAVIASIDGTPREPKPNDLIAVKTTARAQASERLIATKDDGSAKLAIQEANSNFAFDLYQQLSRENESKNLFFSPYSISSALAMTAEGARGKTATEMGTVLRFPKKSRRVGNDAQVMPWKTSMIHTGMGALNERFNRDKKPYKLHVVNALWG